MAGKCKHLPEVRDVTPSVQGCQDGLKTGESWVHLRMCLSRGDVGCRDSSKVRHATKHFQANSHSAMKSFQPGEQWGSCYVDDIYLQL
jgi:hypothetical protein